MLKLTNVNAGYGEIQTVFNISLEVPRGKMVALVGANGAGKTTTLRAISGLLNAKNGAITFDGVPINTMKPHQIARLGIAHVPEGRQLFNELTVKENLLLGAYQRKCTKKELEESIVEVYDMFPKLKERQVQRAGTLSGGEQQMLAIGRGLMMKPNLLMLDEPSLGIAPKLVIEIFDSVARVNKTGVTILIVEQNVVESLGLVNYAYVLQSGEIVAEGLGSELLHSDLIRKSFLGSLH